jgi:hypothetical protein
MEMFGQEGQRDISVQAGAAAGVGESALPSELIN